MEEESITYDDFINMIIDPVMFENEDFQDDSGFLKNPHGCKTKETVLIKNQLQK